MRSWKEKLPLQTIMRLLQVLVPQVEKICIDKYNDLFIANSCYNPLSFSMKYLNFILIAVEMGYYILNYIVNTELCILFLEV